ncbi:hypothetical protein BU14_0135s0002 [Porphyra umbilicalis]|uniref:ATP-dependent (S)-NAD(P)H-hydrate dehydratase n=1 Tax=Porphyra umbilicalis TaxID=2786 RepID=A0A1X6PA47_PORUM|nr:hypothetical protein BU14_0135s0002 [Porphyra umbilicalis]|eukprot:OSX77728.1 hypothetical protein BU14_0135s0002 [Porphyra umbilicalis]
MAGRPTSPAPPLTASSPRGAILDHFRSRVVPPLAASAHKGSHGRLAVLGGCASYAGAPALAGLAALRFGVDLVTVVTPSASAAPSIQSFSPELMVQHAPSAGAVLDLLPRMHGLLVGPGLGRSEEGLDLAAAVLTDVFKGGPAARGGHRGDIPVVLDADALYLLAARSGVWEAARAYRGRLLLTPNAAEATRLGAAAAKLGLCAPGAGGPELAALLGPRGVLVAKGAADVLSWRAPAGGQWRVEGGGSPRRAGGQGDVLAGCLAAAAVWEGLAAPPVGGADGGAGPPPAPPAAAFAACVVARHAQAAAFAKRKRAMGATDVLAEVGAAFEELFPC